MGRTYLFLLVWTGMFIVAAGTSFGSPVFTLTDQNSVAQFDVGSQAGQFNWTVDGVSHVYQQWFWYRVGDSGPEASLDTISAPVATLVGNYLNVQYFGAGFDATLKFLLTGGQAGSGTSDIAETIRINNTSGAELPFHFFQYVDFNLSGVPEGDTVKFLAPNTVQQSKGTTALTETVITPASSHREAAFFPQTLAALNDGLPTTLNDNAGPLGPGNVTWAFQWDANIAPGKTLLISKDKQIVVIPEPATLALLALGGLLLARRRRA